MSKISYLCFSRLQRSERKGDPSSALKSAAVPSVAAPALRAGSAKQYIINKLRKFRRARRAQPSAQAEPEHGDRLLGQPSSAGSHSTGATIPNQTHLEDETVSRSEHTTYELCIPMASPVSAGCGETGHPLNPNGEGLGPISDKPRPLLFKAPKSGHLHMS
jgi:hypothetical protein